MPIYVDFGDPIGDYCKAESFSFSMRMQCVAGGADRCAQNQDVVFSKTTDSLTRDLFLSCMNGTVISSATVEVWTEKACILMYTMKDVMISACQTNQNWDFVTLNYETYS